MFHYPHRTAGHCLCRRSGKFRHIVKLCASLLLSKCHLRKSRKYDKLKTNQSYISLHIRVSVVHTNWSGSSAGSLSPQLLPLIVSRGGPPPDRYAIYRLHLQIYGSTEVLYVGLLLFSLERILEESRRSVEGGLSLLS
jgi:hypothetical protein